MNIQIWTHPHVFPKVHPERSLMLKSSQLANC